MKNIENFTGESPVIRLIEDREVIEKKLEEYRSRLNEFGAPETQLDTIYKIAVTEKLVEKGEVRTQGLSKELEEKYGFIDINLFNNACGVIEDYVKTGGKNSFRGTGLNLEKRKVMDPEDPEQGGRLV